MKKENQQSSSQHKEVHLVAGKHCHDLTGAVKVPEGYKKIVLVGNPNVGKSVFFNAFTGSYVEVSNFPGTTVDINYSKFGDAYLIDTPGVYGVSSFNDEERVARDIILKADQGHQHCGCPPSGAGLVFDPADYRYGHPPGGGPEHDG
jgi:GTPase SAR1 family protein